MELEGLLAAVSRAEFAGQSSLQKAATLNGLTATASRAVITRDIRKYLALVDKLIPLEASTDANAVAAVRYMEIFDEFDLSDATISAKFDAMLTSLITAGLIDATDKAAIQGLSVKPVSEAAQLGFVGLTDQQLADYIDKVEAW